MILERKFIKEMVIVLEVNKKESSIKNSSFLRGCLKWNKESDLLSEDLHYKVLTTLKEEILMTLTT